MSEQLQKAKEHLLAQILNGNADASAAGEVLPKVVDLPNGEKVAIV